MSAERVTRFRVRYGNVLIHAGYLSHEPGSSWWSAETLCRRLRGMAYSRKPDHYDYLDGTGAAWGEFDPDDRRACAVCARRYRKEMAS